MDNADPRDPGDLVDPFDGLQDAEGGKGKGKGKGKKKSTSQPTQDVVTPLVTDWLNTLRQTARDVLYTAGEFWIYEPTMGCWTAQERDAVERMLGTAYLAATGVWPTNKLTSEFLGTLKRITYRASVTWSLGCATHLLAHGGTTVEIKTGTVVKNDPAFMFREQDMLAAPWNPAITKGIWDTALDNVFADLTPADKALAKDTINEWLGASLLKTRPRPMQKAMLFFGEAWTGKSATLEGLRAIWGRQCISSSVAALDTQFGLQSFERARAWACEELPFGKRMNEEVFKQIVTDEPLTINRKFMPVLENQKLGITLGFTANHMPKIGDVSDAVWSRMILVPFNVKIKGTAQEIPNLRDKMREPDEAAYILQCAYQGLVRLSARGQYALPQAWVTTTETIRSDQQPIAEFLRDALVEDQHKGVKSLDLLDAYKGFLASRVGAHEASADKTTTAQIIQQMNTIYPGNTAHRWSRKKITLRKGVKWSDTGLAWLDEGWRLTQQNYQATNQTLLNEATVQLHLQVVGGTP